MYVMCVYSFYFNFTGFFYLAEEYLEIKKLKNNTYLKNFELISISNKNGI